MIIKLLAHATELLQPLDVAVFESLKSIWGRILFERLKFTYACQQLSKAEFTQLIASERGYLKKILSVGFVRAEFFHQTELSIQDHVLALRFWKSTKNEPKKGNQIYAMNNFRRYIQSLQNQKQPH